ncbi:RNA polymerase sigma-70 factor [Nocardiopsis dassonvillei]|uniref:RNA polymerase sigma-70 factor n=1 Tax=Nocardiopsis dassonvillei TaxID=2014 RepID=UPI0020A3A47A|nr:RNA polymerase sigma-70 factor [Nocardiopsis dassonvillei]MCP3016891.1 RNA polymerase sigma-70 factor [Nocardiopsis dassonvillei]
MQSAVPRESGPLEEAARAFTGVRPRLFGIAYRMLGSWAEAEDLVQEVWLRWQRTDRGVVEDPAAFLATTTTRLAINVLKSARVRREAYVGPWLPEPVDTGADPGVGAERGAAVELALLLLMERLTPTERAAYVLREAFDYPYDRIAAVVRTGEANARKLVSRARGHLSGGRAEPVSPQEHRKLVSAFLAAAQAGDLAALEALFAEDVVSRSDGGGRVRNSARVPVAGRDRVARLLQAFAPRFWPGSRTEIAEMNTRPGLVVSRDGTPFALLSIDASAQGIHQLLWVMNPDKIASFQRSSQGVVGAPGSPPGAGEPSSAGEPTC